MRHWKRVLLGLLGLGLLPAAADAGWRMVCDRVPTARILPGSIERPVFVSRPSLRCKQVWISQEILEPEIEDVTFYIHDMEELCLRLDYPIDRCWEILLAVE